MTNEFALELKTARRKAGLTQQDCAQLLSVSPGKISALERGKQLPSIGDICVLSLVYGRTFENLFAGIFKDARYHLRRRINKLVKEPRRWFRRSNRRNTIAGLQHRLDALASDDEDEAA